MALRKDYTCAIVRVVVLFAVATSGHARGVDLGICGSEYFDCQCGEPGYVISIPIKQCTYFYRMRNYCKPCVEITRESFCQKFQNCAECNDAGCTKCPPNNFGKMCTGTCSCQNGGKCDLEGHCICPSTWQGILCETRIINGCPPPESVSNLIWSGSSYKVGDVITANCADGYFLIGDKWRVCNNQGKWSSVAPSCETSCPLPKINGHLQAIINPGQTSKLVDADGREIIKEIGFMCEPGFSLDGPIRTRCQPSGKWDQEPPGCIPKLLCPHPGQIASGQIEISGAAGDLLVPGTQLKITCNYTHFLDGPEVIGCTVSGTWSFPLPRCLKKFGCPPPTIIDNGKVEIAKPVQSTTSKPSGIRSRIGVPMKKRGRTVKLVAVIPSAVQRPPPGFSDVNTRALYTCNSAFYRLIGPSIRVCLSTGQWSGQEPTCSALCGKAGDSKRPSIINGTVSNVGRWPWQAGISSRRVAGYPFSLKCGGSLLTEHLVLTAAHCVTQAFTSRPLLPQNFRVYLGKQFRYDELDDPEVAVLPVDSIIVHPNYHPKSLDSDIALIKLIRPAQFSHRISPVCLPQIGVRKWTDDLPENTTGTVIGWGIAEDTLRSDELKEVELPIVSNNKCENDYRSVNFSMSLTTNMFCAGLEDGGIGTCDGDSGGPFMVESGSGQEASWTQEGIVSFGNPELCAAPKQYSGFLKVYNFVDWINQFM